MAIFRAYNAAEAGFNMSTTSSSGWAFISANPNVSTELVSDTGSTAVYDVYGNAFIDRFTANYWSDGYHIVLDDLYYQDDGYRILSIEDLNLQTTIDDLEGNAWFVTMNTGHDDFYGNDYADIVRAGFGNDFVSAYGGDDTVMGESGNDSVFGGNGDDDLYGGIGRDQLTGGNGSDYLSGGRDADMLTGGAGMDYFAFDVKPSAGAPDTITDFSPRDDTIMLDNAVFTRVGKDGWLAAGAFYVGYAAHDSSDRIIYNKATGALSYDPDGIGGAAAIKFAQVKAGLTLTKGDFFIL